CPQEDAGCSCVRGGNRRCVRVRAADVWQQPRPTAIARRMATRARGRGSRYGIDGPILETSLGSIGTVLEAATREAGRRKPEVRNAASGAGAIEPLAEGETNPAALAALADARLRATPEQLCDALGACTDLQPVYRRLLNMALEQLQFLEQQIGQLDQEMASLLHPHQDAVQRLAEVPGLGVDSAQQIIAEVGSTAATFPSAKCLSSWVG